MQLLYQGLPDWLTAKLTLQISPACTKAKKRWPVRARCACAYIPSMRFRLGTWNFERSF